MKTPVCSDMRAKGNSMKKILTTMKSLWKDESAQGATEYILLLVVVVALVIMFKGKITDALKGKTDELSTGMGSVNIDQ
jgi:Flp pilus assembly pilin Flp